MRGFNFAVSFAFACVFLFAGMAPVDHDLYTSNIAPQVRGSVEPDDNAWPIDSVDSAIPEEPTDGVPNTEPGEPRKPTALVETPSIGLLPVSTSSTYTPGARYSGIAALLIQGNWNGGTTTVASGTNVTAGAVAEAPSGVVAVTVRLGTATWLRSK